MSERLCLTCQQVKPRSDFQSKGKWGPDAHCKPCRRELDRRGYVAGLSPEARERYEWRRTATPEQRKERYRQAALAKRLAKKPSTKPYGRRVKISGETATQRLARSRRKQRARVLGFYRGLKRKPCQDCGGIFHPAAMEFDHLRDKAASVSSLKCEARIAEEAAKCDLVCANCHRVRTERRRSGFPPTLPPPEYEI